MKNKIIIGSRGSKLALIYAKRAKTELLKNSEIGIVEIKSIKTTGDTMTDVRLSEHGGKGLSLIHISEPTRRTPISYAVFCLKKIFF